MIGELSRNIIYTITSPMSYLGDRQRCFYETFGGKMQFTQIFWITFAILAALTIIIPAIRQKILERARLKKLREIENKRDSRVIFLIHRQERIAFLGIPILRYLTIDESEKILRAIRETDPQKPIDLILHTPGGLMLAAEQIAYALCAHPARINVIIPHYAMSGGTLIALASDEIILDKNGVLGPVDPQLNDQPAASILTAVSKKDVNELDDETLILADIGEKAIQQVKNTILRIVAERLDKETAENLADNLTKGKWTHDFPIRVEEAEDLGLPINTDVPEEVYDLMALFPQSTQRRPSVHTVPIRKKEHKDGNSNPQTRLR